MEGSWNHGKAHYRCQVRRDDPVDRNEHLKTVYLREEAILPHVDAWVAELFDDDHIDHTAQLLAAASEPDADEVARRKDLRNRINKLTAEIDGYHTIIREQPDTASEVGRWMAQTIQEKRRIENLLGAQPSTRITVDDVKAMLAGLRDLTRSLGQADATVKAAAYAELGITVTYHADGRALLESRPLIGGVGEDGVGGGT